MSEQNPQDKKYVTEWSFSFDKLGEGINKLLGSVGGGETEIKHASYAEPVGDAIGAKIILGPAVGKIQVEALAASENLFEAEVAYIGELEYSAAGDAEKTVKLGQKSSPFSVGVKHVLNQVANREDLLWQIGISPTVPVELEVNGGVGSSRFDLSQLRLTGLKVEGGVGEVQVTLPVGEARYGVKLDGGVGGTRVTIPEGAALNLRIDGGVGGIDLHVPANAAVRVEAEGGLGGVSVPKHFNRVRGGEGFVGMNGVWETMGFNLASTQVFIHFKGGVGGLKIV